MHFKYLLAFLLMLAGSYSHTACSSNDKSADRARGTKEPAAPMEYDLENPVVIKLPEQLNEISGISFYAKDTSLFSVSDEDGILYKIYLNRNNRIETWRFDKKQDFEDIVLHDSIFYVLISNGDIERLAFSGNTITTAKSVFPGKGNDNEFETLYHDDKKGLVIICKQCRDDKKKTVSAYSYDPATDTYGPAFSIDVLPVDEQLGEQKMHLKPSAAAINPVTNELYILCSVNKVLLITDRNGRFKRVFRLSSKIYKQPEGITFTPAGDMIISNEFAELGSPNLLILKRKRKRS